MLKKKQSDTNKDGKGQAKGGMRGRGGMDGSGRVVLPVALHIDPRNRKTPSDAISLLVMLLQPVTPACDILSFVVS
ncbi:hypothetical protein Tco_0111409 [Tanacetum coccineum]